VTRALRLPKAERQDAHVATPVPETHSARMPDGVSLAYHAVGDGPVDRWRLYRVSG
jgi:hypothetical protein